MNKAPETREEYVKLVSLWEDAVWLADVIDTPCPIETKFRRDKAYHKAVECEKLFEQCKFYIDENNQWCEKEK